MIDRDKMRHAGVLSTWLYIKSVEADRPQRAFRQSDVVILEELAVKINNVYQNAKLVHGRAADFESCMNKIVTEARIDCSSVRNLYASTLMTYFRWRQKRYVNEYNKKRLYLDRLWHFLQFTQEKEET
jgi:hypothetical protein